MEQTPKPLRNLVVRILLLGVFLLAVRFFYVVVIRGESCDSNTDFCFFSATSAQDSPPIAGTGISAATAAATTKAFIRGTEIPIPRPEWSSREWRKAVAFYSAAFQDLLAEGVLSQASKAVSVGTPVGHEVFALKEVGVSDAVGVARKKAQPLVVAGDLSRLPFDNATFDFVFSGPETIDKSSRLADLTSELTRVLKPEGFLVVHTSSAGDLYSLDSFLAMFPSFKMIRSHERNSPGSTSVLRELLLQKKEGILIRSRRTQVEDNDTKLLLPGGKFPNKCSIPNHKIEIVSSAEPLIEEEPLKPWITLKKNVKNVKYLPTMVDISFKRRYIYIDVGSRSYVSSIGSWFKKQYPKQNRTFEVYAIEADRAFHSDYAMRKGVKLLPFAAWVRNETLSFEVSGDPDVAKERGMGRIKPVSGASDSGDVHSIRGFDLAEWLKNTVSETDFVVMKMDVEGTEFDLIPRLFETGAICLIDELFLECHYNRWQRCCPGVRSPKYEKTYGQCLDLFTSLRASGVLVHQWW